MGANHYSIPELADYSRDLGVLDRKFFMLEASQALGLDTPAGHDEVEINGQRVFAEADEVSHAEMRIFDTEGEYSAGDLLSHTEASYGPVIVVLERTMELPGHFGLHAYAWRTEATLAQQFRADIYDRGSNRPDDSVWVDIAQSRLTELIPLPFFMRRAASLAVKAEKEALDLATKTA